MENILRASYRVKKIEEILFGSTNAILTYIVEENKDDPELVVEHTQLFQPVKKVLRIVSPIQIVSLEYRRDSY